LGENISDTLIKSLSLSIGLIFNFAILLSQDGSLYRDISKEHWAYRAIENLIDKGIIEKDSQFFNGEDSVSRYETSIYLYRVLNKLDKEKASKDDLIILENLVGEFSEDLTEFGFNIDKYTNKIHEIEKNIKDTTKISENNKGDIDNIDNRLKILENYFTEEGEEEKEAKTLFRNFGIIENMSLDFKENLYYNNKSDNDFINEQSMEFMIDNKFYEIGLTYKSDSKLDEKLNLKGKINKNIADIFEIKANTMGYEKDINSYFHHLDYDNFDYDKREFYTQGLKIQNKYIDTYIERKNSEKDIIILNKVKNKYFNGFIENEINESIINYELILKKRFFNEKLSLATGYTGLTKTDYIGEKKDIELYNLKTHYEYEKWKLEIEYEKKDANKNLYNGIFSYFNYNITDYGTLDYRVEYFDTKLDAMFNHKIILKNEKGKIKTYFMYVKNELEKNDYINTTISKDELEKDNKYSDIILKIQYMLLQNLNVNFSYKERKYSIENINQALYFVEFEYQYDSNTLLFVRYLKNNSIYYDRYEDINYNQIDLDFDSESNIIEEASDGRIELGIELKF